MYGRMTSDEFSALSDEAKLRAPSGDAAEITWRRLMSVWIRYNIIIAPPTRTLHTGKTHYKNNFVKKKFLKNNTVYTEKYDHYFQSI